MKRILSMVLVMFIAVSLIGCTRSSNNEENINDTPAKEETNDMTKSNDNILIAYYSLSGNTEKAAQEIQNQTGGELVEITRKEDYPDDFYDIAENEIINGDQPEISFPIDSIGKYDVIFVGYPIWWKEAPAMINTFVHQFDFSGKTIVPFCTSSSDGIEESLDVFDDIKEKGTIAEGLRISGYDEIAGWLDRVLK